MADGGALVVRTGIHTGRSPNDKFIVEDSESKGRIDWGKTNKADHARSLSRLYNRMIAYAQRRDLFVRDCWAGADPAHRIGVRVVNETAWHNLFARNMFLRPKPEELEGFKPEFTILNLPGFQADPKLDGTASDCAILVNFTERVVAICGTWYAGEIKKSVFTILNYLLPDKNVLPMHASANVGPEGRRGDLLRPVGHRKDHAVGRSDAHADRRRRAWLGRGQPLQLRGRLLRQGDQAQPRGRARDLRHHRPLRHGAGECGDRSGDRPRSTSTTAAYTENTRACYPLDFIPNTSPTGMAGTPENIVMLTADAFGVLPPISRLTPEQAMYHFLSGYTARVAGTEKGVTEPQATFSTCFGAPFMPRHPTVYAKMLGEKMARQHVKCWLVNTGWSGGGFGVGERMSIRHTRAMVRAALDGTLAAVASSTDPHFGMQVPSACPDVPGEVLNPKNTWKDKKAYDSAARDVAQRFEKNFQQFESHVDDKVNKSAIRAAA